MLLKKSKWLLITLGLGVLVVILVGVGIYVYLRRQKLVEYRLQAIYVEEEPVLDGKASDRVWRKAPPTVVPIEEGLPVTMKAVYTQEKIFFLATYEDKTRDHVDEVWEYDGKRWRRGRTSDEFVLFFNINNSIKNFNEEGFAVLTKKPGVPGRKLYELEATGGAFKNSSWEKESWKADVWEMSTSLSSPFGKGSDHFFSAVKEYRSFHVPVRPDVKVELKHDSFEYPRPFYLNSVRATALKRSGDKPRYSLKPGLTIKNKPYPYREDMEEITDYSVFRRGDRQPFIFYEKGKTWGGSKDDIDGKAFWSKGKWTIEMGRKLNTGHPDDIVFSPRKTRATLYHFGILVRSDGKTIKPSPPVTLEFIARQGGGEK